jgi:DNA (cytosine-5)-methyltransferase 1
VNVLDLFSGIGGFSLGLERAGMRTVAFCEIEPFARRVLAKHWPDVPCYDDVRSLTAERLAADGIAPVDVICGGFPCQDISLAGKGAGLAGERSGLWREYARIIGEFRPRYVVVENVAALLGRGLDDVLGDLAALGYDAEWHCIPASAVGAPHRRDRLWLVADTLSLWKLQSQGRERDERGWIGDGSQDVADASRARLSIAWPESLGANWEQVRRLPAASGGWATEPDVGRVAHGVPSRVDRLRALGNAVVPQIPEIIGRAIMRAAA